MTSGRYLPTYRQDEVQQICRLARRGDSLGFVGLAGVGKSNLVQFLGNRKNLIRYLGDAAERVHFADVNMVAWEKTPAHLWELMLRALLNATRGVVEPAESATVIQIAREQRTLDRLQAQLEAVCQTHGHQVVFILDDFDTALAAGPLSMLEQLYALRDHGNRDRLGYLVLTKRLPHMLGRAHSLEADSKFYDLIRSHIYGLGPHRRADAEQMLMHLNANVLRPLRPRDFLPILDLAGGHAGLLKAIFELWRDQGEPGADRVRHFAAQAQVQEVCRRIMRGLHPQEQRVARRLAHSQHTAEDRDTVDHLARRGLLTALDPVTWFSPIMPEYLRNHYPQEEL